MRLCKALNSLPPKRMSSKRITLDLLENESDHRLLKKPVNVTIKVALPVITQADGTCVKNFQAIDDKGWVHVSIYAAKHLKTFEVGKTFMISKYDWSKARRAIKVQDETLVSKHYFHFLLTE